MQCVIPIDFWLLATLCMLFLACGLIVGGRGDHHERHK